MAVGQFGDLAGEVCRLVVDGVIGASGADEVKLLSAASHRQDASSQRLAELHRRRSPRCPPPPAPGGPRPRLVKYAPPAPRRPSGMRSGTLLPAHRIGQAGRARPTARARRRIRRIRPSLPGTRLSHDLLADGESRSRGRRDDVSGHFFAEPDRRLVQQREIALRHQQVRQAGPCRTDPDKHLTWLRVWPAHLSVIARTLSGRTEPNIRSATR